MKKRPKPPLNDTNDRHFPKLDHLILAFLPETKERKEKQNKIQIQATITSKG
jgi:hypothetical protein